MAASSPDKREIAKPGWNDSTVVEAEKKHVFRPEPLKAKKAASTLGQTMGPMGRERRVNNFDRRNSLTKSNASSHTINSVNYVDSVVRKSAAVAGPAKPTTPMLTNFKTVEMVTGGSS